VALRRPETMKTRHVMTNLFVTTWMFFEEIAMYCPNCAAPIDGAKFCRSCGSNVSLVPRAMSGEFPQSDESEGAKIGIVVGRGRHRRLDRHGKKEPSIERASTSFFSGIGFLMAALYVCFYFPGGFTWGWAFLFPAFSLMGEGVGQYLRLKEQRRQQSPINQPGAPPAVYAPPEQVPALSVPTTSELVKPSSVTEQTTRHLESSRPSD